MRWCAVTALSAAAPASSSHPGDRQASHVWDTSGRTALTRRTTRPERDAPGRAARPGSALRAVGDAARGAARTRRTLGAERDGAAGTARPGRTARPVRDRPAGAPGTRGAKHSARATVGVEAWRRRRRISRSDGRQAHRGGSRTGEQRHCQFATFCFHVNRATTAAGALNRPHEKNRLRRTGVSFINATTAVHGQGGTTARPRSRSIASTIARTPVSLSTINIVEVALAVSSDSM
jgi:hypothetical protein